MSRQVEVDEARLWSHLRVLCEEIGARLSGTPADEQAVRYMAGPGVANVLIGGQPHESVGLWLGAGLLAGSALLLAYVLVLRHHQALLPIAGATVAALEILADGRERAYPGALLGAIAACVIIADFAWLWTRRMINWVRMKLWL